MKINSVSAAGQRTVVSKHFAVDQSHDSIPKLDIHYFQKLTPEGSCINASGCRPIKLDHVEFQRKGEGGVKMGRGGGRVDVCYVIYVMEIIINQSHCDI